MANTLLIVEDEATLAKMYSTKLSREGYRVEVAASGEEALEKVKTVTPDLVLMDIMMPGLNGLEVLKKLKTMPATKEKPVIMLTNLSGTSEKEEALKAGAVGYIVKSELTPDELVSKIKGTLSAPVVEPPPATEKQPQATPLADTPDSQNQVKYKL